MREEGRRSEERTEREGEQGGAGRGREADWLQEGLCLKEHYTQLMICGAYIVSSSTDLNCEAEVSVHDIIQNVEPLQAHDLHD